MSLIENVILTVLGGLAAGLIGYIGTIANLKEERKKEHLKEHKKNLETVSKALDYVFNEIWIFVEGPDFLKLPRSPFWNEKWVANIEIKKVPIIIESSDQFSDNSRVQVGIDSVLYDDISLHFKELSELLNKTERYAKNNGVETFNLLNELSRLIYEKLNASEIDFPVLNGNKNELKKFRELHDDDEQNYAGSVFLMAIGEDEEKWPNKVSLLKNNNIYDNLKKLADEIKDDNGEKLKKLLEIHNELHNYIEECKEEIKRIEHTTKLKGSCPYL